MKKNIVKKLFYLLLFFFVVLAASIVAPAFSGQGYPILMFVSWGIFLILGILLVIFTHKKQDKGRLKGFLLLSGYSAIGLIASILLHNFLYALAVTYNLQILEVLEIAFFLFGVFVCPIAFLVGAFGSVVLFTKNKKTAL